MLPDRKQCVAQVSRWAVSMPPARSTLSINISVVSLARLLTSARTGIGVASFVELSVMVVLSVASCAFGDSFMPIASCSFLTSLLAAFRSCTGALARCSFAEAALGRASSALLFSGRLAARSPSLGSCVFVRG